MEKQSKPLKIKKAQPMPVTPDMEKTLSFLPRTAKTPEPPKDLKEWKQQNSTPEWNRKAAKIRAKRKLQRKNRKSGRRK